MPWPWSRQSGWHRIRLTRPGRRRPTARSACRDPAGQDPGYPFVNPVASFRFGDISNPNLRPWAKDVMKKDNDEIDAGKIQFTANSSCLPSGLPVLMLLPGPFYLL